MSRSGPLTVNNILVGATDVHGSSSSKPTTNTTNASLKYGTFASDPAATINSTLPVAKATWIPQQAGNYAGSSTNDTNATPISFGQMVPSPSGKISTPEAARTGGRRSRGMRHRGTPMIGGSMSVFSVRPDGPRTPTSRARGSIHSKPSRTPSGSNNKRKRSEGNASGDSESSENFTPLSQSRSGRKIVQVAQTTPVIKIEDEVKPSPKGNKKTSPTAKHASKVVEKRKSNSKKTPGGSAAVCKNCGRLHSPESNAMVFCDGCNTGWHQHCHDPPISQDIVLIESKEWFCTDCIVLKEEKSRLHGKVSGQNMSLLDVRIVCLHNVLKLTVIET